MNNKDEMIPRALRASSAAGVAQSQ